MTNEKATYCFTDKSGKKIFLFKLCNAAGTEVTISNYGAIILSFIVKDKMGKPNDIVLGFDRIEDYFSSLYLENYPWFGAAVGRNANRIKNGRFDIDGKSYQLSRNSGHDHLHGGLQGFDRKTWDVAAHTDELLELIYRSPDGEEGYPGNLDVSLRFALNDANELSYTYTAVTDKATVINLTHHGYFNLDNGQDNISNQVIRIHATSMLEQDEELIVTGNVLPVANTPFDFRSFKRIGEQLEQVGEYDKSYVVDQQETKLVAEAISERSGLHLQIYSTEPIVHFYSGKWIPVVKGKNDTVYGPFSGFCLETHKHPNAVNIPHFPNTILRPGETYHQQTMYKII